MRDVAGNSSTAEMTLAETPPRAEDAPPVRTLLIDNDRHHAEAMAESLESAGFVCELATSGPTGAERLEEGTFDVVITDLVMDRVDGMEILRRAGEMEPSPAVVVVTGHASVTKAVEALQQGAVNFLEKPITPQRLRAVASRAADVARHRREIADLRGRLDRQYGFRSIIHVSSAMKRMIERLERIAPTDASVLIQGQWGTGKELIAQAIHQNSSRKRKPFVAINCAAIPDNLVESELFGHVKGAFTDALKDREGVFEYANGGTLFLDEVGDMPLQTQVKLLRVLEERTITRVGDNKAIPVNVRILSATNRDLTTACETGQFRKDLYYRLKVCTVDLPRLADRIEDVVPLAQAFRTQLAARHHKTVREISRAVFDRFRHYDWPGNVRELRNVIESMVVLDVDGVLDVDDLPLELAEGLDLGSVGPTSDAAEGSGLEGAALIGRTWDEIERYVIEQTLASTGGNREEAAKILGLGVRTIYRKLDKYQKDDGDA